MKKYCFCCLGVVLTAFALRASAGSFQVPLQGAQNSAMAGAGVALPLDASTIFYNPAGISSLPGWQVSVNGFMVDPSVGYATATPGNYSANNIRHASTPFGIYISSPVSKTGLSVGMGVYTPFGSHLDWGNDWIGKYVIQSIKMQSIYFQPTVSYAITPRLSVGAGLVYAIGSVDISQALPVQFEDGADAQAKLKGNGKGWGFNVGASYKASDQWNFGASFRSGVTVKVSSGDATFNVPASLAANFPNTNFSARLPLAHMLTAGATYKPCAKWTVTADVIYAMWSRYDSLKFDFVQNTATLQDLAEPRDYKNTLAVRAGAKYDISQAFSIMAGGALDPTPSRDYLMSPDAVDAFRISASAGLSYKPAENLTITAACMYTTNPTRTASYEVSNFSGKYKIQSFSPGLGISYKF